VSLTTEEATELATLKSVWSKLILGQAVDRVSYNGFETAFKPADLKRVEGRIDFLESKQCGGSGRKRGALGFNVR
jgi:hypothetical protein